MDGLRRSTGARSRCRTDPRIASEYLSFRCGQPPVSPDRYGSIPAVGNLASHQMESRLGDLGTSQAVRGRVRHGWRAVAPHLLDRARKWLFLVDCIANRGSGLANGEWTALVGGSSTGGAAIELASSIGKTGLRPFLCLTIPGRHPAGRPRSSKRAPARLSDINFVPRRQKA
jgi:hypothetical protein